MPYSEYQLDLTDAEKLSSIDLFRTLMSEVEDFTDSVLDDDDQILTLFLLAKDRLEELTGKTLAWRDFTNELYDGNDRAQLDLRHVPILSVSSVTVTSSGVVTTLVQDTDYWVYRDHLAFLTFLPRGHKNVKVTYRAGLRNVVVDGNLVSLSTARVIALVSARAAILEVASGPAESSSISAGPVSLRESFGPHGQFYPKLVQMSQEIQEWVNAHSGLRMKTVGYQRFPRSLRREYVPRLDAFVDG